MIASKEIMAQDRYHELRETLGEQIAAQREDMIALKGSVQSLNSSVSVLMNRIDGMGEKWEAARRPNMLVLAAFTAIMITIIPGCWFVINSVINNAIGPVTARLAQIEGGNTERDRRATDLAAAVNGVARDASVIAQQATLNSEGLRRNTETITKLLESNGTLSVSDGIARTDRIQMNNQITEIQKKLSDSIAYRSGVVAEVSAKLSEVQQQFHSIGDINNTHWATQHQFNATTYEKLHPGERYPDMIFFPSTIFQANPPGLSKP